MSTILVVDDKEMLRDSVGATLQRANFTILAAADGKSALEMVARRRPDVVVTDLRMPGMTGVELLENIREFDDDLPVIVMTAFGAVDTAVRAMKHGAFDYLTKPFEGDELIITVRRAIEHARIRRENAVLRLAGGGPGDDASPVGQTSGPRGLDRLVGDSGAMRKVKDQVRAVAGAHGTVLISGESGVGKEVIARAIHEMSPRCAESFLALNCPALAESLLESELFGHEKGAFTGADRLRKGRFELADRGSLLLDEISEVSPRIQAKLLRVLQERAFERVGSSATIEVDVRVIATTNRDLHRAVAGGDFRQDLYFRLNVLPVHIPPLRERPEDVPTLADHFVERVARREGIDPPRFTDAARQRMLEYRWPGNVRELQNLCERAVVLSRELGTIEADLIAPWLSGPGAGPATGAPAFAAASDSASIIEPSPVHKANGGGAPCTLEEIERRAIVETLVRFNGHRQRTAEALGIGVRTLGLKLKKWKELRLVAETL